MIIMQDQFFPNESLPDLIHLMWSFDKALRVEIEIFEEDGDRSRFFSVLSGLRRDLKVYIKNFDAMYQNARNADEFGQLEELARYLAKGKALVVKAIGLLKD